MQGISINDFLGVHVTVAGRVVGDTLADSGVNKFGGVLRHIKAWPKA